MEHPLEASRKCIFKVTKASFNSTVHFVTWTWNDSPLTERKNEVLRKCPFFENFKSKLRKKAKTKWQWVEPFCDPNFAEFCWMKFCMESVYLSYKNFWSKDSDIISCPKNDEFWISENINFIPLTIKLIKKLWMKIISFKIMNIFFEGVFPPTLF